MIATPYTWLDQFTLRNAWFGGYRDEMTNQDVFFEGQAKMIMESYGFEQVHVEQVHCLFESTSASTNIISEASKKA